MPRREHVRSSRFRDTSNAGRAGSVWGPSPAGLMNEDKAARYHRLRRRTSVAGTGTALACLALIAVSGTGTSLAGAAAARAGRTGASLLIGAALAVVLAVLALPFDASQQRLERRYGLATRPAVAWWGDWLRSALVTVLLFSAGALALTATQAVSPDWWWLWCAGLATGATAVLARLAPVILVPLLDRCVPLQRPDLALRLRTLAQRAGADFTGVFEWQVAWRTRVASATLAGGGVHRRVLLSDTLLDTHTDEEIEVIVAHEIGHQVHRDLWTGLALDGGLLAVALYVVATVGPGAAEALGSGGAGVQASLPLYLLIGWAVWLGLRPVSYALSRAHERRADRFALELTGNASAFVRAVERLSARNLAEESPSRAVEFWSTHPPVAARLAAARARLGFPVVSG